MKDFGLVSEAVVLLERMALISPGDEVQIDALSGGVSSDIWLVRRNHESFVLKRAREKLNVTAEWHAPVNRGASEAAWLTFAGTVVPGCAPTVLAVDEISFAMALQYFDADVYHNWKIELLEGRINAAVAGAVGRTLGRIQAESTRTPGLATRFANDTLFETLRIEPYLRRTARAMPEVRGAVDSVISELESTHLGLVHGDLSPKNILVATDESEHGPVILDAECATWGDPVFDAAFCLTHLALKEIHLPIHATAYRAASQAFERAYLEEVTWEDPLSARERILRILPTLLLARVVGASPVEYLSADEQSLVVELATSALHTGSSIWDIVDKEGKGK